MKERLTGAIILVVLIVLLVPELLSGPSRSVPASRSTTAPASASSEEPPLRSYTIDLADESHNATPSASTSGAPPQVNGPSKPSTILEHTAQDSVPPQQQDGSASSPSVPQTSEVPEQPAQAAPSPAPVPPRQAPREPTPPARQSPLIAQRSSDKPSAPQQRYAAAEKRSAPEQRSAPEKRSAPEHGEKSGGWTVQVGVFAKRANAERLVKELQQQGFHTSVSENTSGGRTLYWVRTSPMAERATAEQLSARLRAAGHVGSVVPK